VVIQNAEQVNIAADGGQQMNVQQQRKGKSRKGESGRIRRSQRTAAPKQIDAKKESLEMKTVSEAIQVE
jgi:hypothetical protein